MSHDLVIRRIREVESKLRPAEEEIVRIGDGEKITEGLLMTTGIGEKRIRKGSVFFTFDPDNARAAVSINLSRSLVSGFRRGISSGLLRARARGVDSEAELCSSSY